MSGGPEQKEGRRWTLGYAPVNLGGSAHSDTPVLLDGNPHAENWPHWKLVEVMPVSEAQEQIEAAEKEAKACGDEANRLAEMWRDREAELQARAEAAEKRAKGLEQKLRLALTALAHMELMRGRNANDESLDIAARTAREIEAALSQPQEQEEPK